MRGWGLLPLPITLLKRRGVLNLLGNAAPTTVEPIHPSIRWMAERTRAGRGDCPRLLPRSQAKLQANNQGSHYKARSTVATCCYRTSMLKKPRRPKQVWQDRPAQVRGAGVRRHACVSQLPVCRCQSCRRICGTSPGEYTALCVAGAFTFEVRCRAHRLQGVTNLGRACNGSLARAVNEFPGLKIEHKPYQCTDLPRAAFGLKGKRISAASKRWTMKILLLHTLAFWLQGSPSNRVSSTVLLPRSLLLMSVLLCWRHQTRR